MDKYDRQEIESVHDRAGEELNCNHQYTDGRPAWRVLLGRCVAQCAICGDENDLNPLCVKQLREPREETSTYEEVVEALFIEALRVQAKRERKQAKFLDAGDL